MIDLRALVSSPHWRWLPGMLAFVPTLEPGETDPAKWIAKEEWRTDGRDRLSAECFPDLDDEITATLLLILVRRAWQDPHMYAYFNPFVDRWAVVQGSTPSSPGAVVAQGPTEAAALAAADVTLYTDGSAIVTLTPRGDTCTSSTVSSCPSEHRRTS